MNFSFSDFCMILYWIFSCDNTCLFALRGMFTNVFLKNKACLIVFDFHFKLWTNFLHHLCQCFSNCSFLGHIYQFKSTWPPAIDEYAVFADDWRWHQAADIWSEQRRRKHQSWRRMGGELVLLSKLKFSFIDLVSYAFLYLFPRCITINGCESLPLKVFS